MVNNREHRTALYLADSQSTNLNKIQEGELQETQSIVATRKNQPPHVLIIVNEHRFKVTRAHI